MEPADGNLSTYSYRIYELFLRACTEFEANCKGILSANAYIQANIQAATEKLRVLSAQVEQQELIKERFASEDSLALAGKLQQQTERRVRLMGQKSDAVEELTQVKGDSAILQQQLDQQQAAYDAAEDRNARLRQELSKELELSGRTARIPQVRKTEGARSLVNENAVLGRGSDDSMRLVVAFL